MAKVKRSEISIEKQKEQRLQFELKEIKERLYLIPLPTHLFNVGDRAIIGRLEDVYVEEVLEQGRIYKIDYTFTENNYGNPIKYEHNKRYVGWFDIRKYQENTSDNLIKNKDLQLCYSQRSMRDLITKAYFFGVDFNPDYQRDYVWELEDKISLIDSIFNNVDIGKFVFIKNDVMDNYMYEILDGKQRLRAILDFYEDRFQYEGKYFSDLSIREQDFIEDYSITIAEVDDITKEQVLRYFIKLNRSGKVMSKEQLEKVEKMLEDKTK